MRQSDLLPTYREEPTYRSDAPVNEMGEAFVYYAGCDQARAVGKAPIYRGQPGNRTGMDGDPDGIACEPYP